MKIYQIQNVESSINRITDEGAMGMYFKYEFCIANGHKYRFKNICIKLSLRIKIRTRYDYNDRESFNVHPNELTRLK